MIANQVTYILRFFLSKNLRIVRDRAWDQVVYSRGKGPDFWRPYVEEYAVPPVVRKGSIWEKAAGNYLGRFLIRRGTFCMSKWNSELITLRFFFVSLAGALEFLSSHWNRDQCVLESRWNSPLFA